MDILKQYVKKQGFKKIAFQGSEGAWSHQACNECLPSLEAIACDDFESALNAVETGIADLGMIPIDNSLAGRVADVHALLPKTSLHIVGEHYLPIAHHLLGVNGASIEDLKEVHSHVHALSQCRNILRQHKIKPVIGVDTAGCAKEIAKKNNKSIGVIASKMAADIYGMQSLKEDIADGDVNVTRFAILARKQLPLVSLNEAKTITSFVFKARNIPSSLYKALGGFATNGVNLTRIESYLHMSPTVEFWIDAYGHPNQVGFDNALEELDYFSLDVRIFGSYERSPLREKQR
ncbi:MAG: prephenate dehydratase [Alphaproteobacteria bacterium]